MIFLIFSIFSGIYFYFLFCNHTSIKYETAHEAGHTCYERDINLSIFFLECCKWPFLISFSLANTTGVATPSEHVNDQVLEPFDLYCCREHTVENNEKHRINILYFNILILLFIGTMPFIQNLTYLFGIFTLDNDSLVSRFWCGNKMPHCC